MSEPPPILDRARVLEYAEVDTSVRYTGRITLYVGSKEIGALPNLAICQNTWTPIPETFLFYCDQEWNVIVAGAYSSIEAARDSAEVAYDGISAKWKKLSPRS